MYPIRHCMLPPPIPRPPRLSSFRVRRDAHRYALSTLGVPRVGVVDVPWSAMAEQWGFKAKASALVFHMKRPKAPSRLLQMHGWQAAHHCATPSTRATCGRVPRSRYERQYRPAWLRSCADAESAGRSAFDRTRSDEMNASARWLLCNAPLTVHENCSDAVVDLRQLLRPQRVRAGSSRST